MRTASTYQTRRLQFDAFHYRTQHFYTDQMRPLGYDDFYRLRAMMRGVV